VNRIDRIRDEERKYHEACYDNYRLFEEGSWLHKPVKIVMDLMAYFEGRRDLSVLDLGCGVGRNSIPLAEKLQGTHGKVVCVDLLEQALSKLISYSRIYHVEPHILPVQADIGDYPITPNEYDFIIAVSSLEHVKSKEILHQVLRDMAEGTKDDGIHCIIFNTNVKEVDIETKLCLEPSIEVNMTTSESMALLENHYEAWEKVNIFVKPLKFEIIRDGRPVLLTTDCITYTAKKATRTS
jgi:SAM-dependent methyltransferase